MAAPKKKRKALAKRSESARRGWATRRRNQESAKRKASAAKRKAPAPKRKAPAPKRKVASPKRRAVTPEQAAKKLPITKPHAHGWLAGWVPPAKPPPDETPFQRAKRETREAKERERANKRANKKARARWGKGHATEFYGRARNRLGKFVKRGEGESRPDEEVRAKALLADDELLRFTFKVMSPIGLRKSIERAGGLRSAAGYAVFLRVLYGKDAAVQWIRGLYGKK